MTKSILIVGGNGRMGKIIANELVHDYDITIADVSEAETTAWKHNIHTVKVDVTDHFWLSSLAKKHDLIVSTLPADISYGPLLSCTGSGKPIIDLSYLPQNMRTIDQFAKLSGSTVILDTGVAPGLTNLIIGHVLGTQEKIESGKLYVGGVATNRHAPYGYRVTWSPTDLLAEYQRPARYIDNKRIVAKPALSDIEEISIIGAGIMEAFLTDGLRTLLTVEKIDSLVEKTLRWPGHVEQIKPLLEQNTFIEEITKQCSSGDDMVVLYCNIDGRQFSMIEHNKDELTAMQRTTALTCSIFVRLVAEIGKLPAGVLTPEDIGRNEACYDFIINNLDSRFNIKITEE